MTNKIQSILNKWKEDIANSRLWNDYNEVSDLIKEIEDALRSDEVQKQ